MKAAQKRSLTQSVSSKPWKNIRKDMDYHPTYMDPKYLNHKKLRYQVQSSVSSLPSVSQTKAPQVTSSIQSILRKESFVPNQQHIDSSMPWIYSSKIPSVKSKTSGHDVFTNKQIDTKLSPWLIHSQEKERKRNIPSYQVHSSKQNEDSYNQWYQNMEQTTGIRDDLMTISAQGTHIFPEKNEWTVTTPLDSIGQQKHKQKIHITNTESIFHKDLQPPQQIYDEQIQSTQSRHHTHSESRSHGQFEPHQQSIPSMDRMYDYANQKATHNKQTELRQKAHSFSSI
jgi:hypothetical protein